MEKTKEKTEDQKLTEFQTFLRERRLSDNTILSYCGSVRLYRSLYPAISRRFLKQYRGYLLGHYKPSTACQRIHGINRFLEYQNMPELRLAPVRPRGVSFQDRVISDQDYRTLKRRLKKDGAEKWYFIVWFLGATGARVSELLCFKAEHLPAGYMDLYSKGGKMRRIYIPEALCREAAAWCGRRQLQSGPLFVNRQGKPLTARGVNAMLKHYALRYRLDPAAVHAHAFRHRFALNFLKRCNDLSLLADLLGHDKVETTRIYLTRSSKEQRMLIDRLVTW